MKKICCVKMILAAIGVSAALLAQPAASFGATLHAIIIADTNDPSIGSSVYKDLRNISDLAELVASSTDMTLNRVLLDRSKSTVSNLESAIDGLAVRADDLLLFYFSGHGDRRKDQTSPLPTLILNSGILRTQNFSQDAVRAATIELNDVIYSLAAKQPRLLIALADACDRATGILDSGDLLSATKKTAASSGLNTESFRKLFASPSGVIIAASASTGEVSAAKRNGGAFTLQFLNVLYRELASSSPTWENIRAKAAQPIRTSFPEGDEVQTPQWTMEFSATPSQTVGSAAPEREDVPENAPTGQLSVQEFYDEFTAAVDNNDAYRIQELVKENPQTAGTLQNQLSAMGRGRGRDARAARELADLLGEYQARATGQAVDDDDRTMTPILTPTPNPARPTPQARSAKNLLRNGNFAQGAAGWNRNATNLAIYRGEDGIPFLATNNANHRIASPSVYQDIKGLPAGRTYTFDAEVSAVIPGTNITMTIWELGGGPNINAMQQYDAVPGWQRFSVSYRKQRANSTLRLEIYYEEMPNPADVRIRDAHLQ